MYSKDDGIDSGEGGGGTIVINNCWFESNIHEGLALSSMSPLTKNHYVKNSTFVNCGQGLELGYSSENHYVEVIDCQFYNNRVGIRYGDNYKMPVRGNILIKNCESIDNYSKDIWNMVRKNWKPKKDNMKFVNCKVSKAVKLYPNLIIKQ